MTPDEYTMTMKGLVEEAIECGLSHEVILNMLLQAASDVAVLTKQDVEHVVELLRTHVASSQEVYAQRKLQ